jgi:hypothetical protein
MPAVLFNFIFGGCSSFIAGLGGGTPETGDFSAGIRPEASEKIATNAAGVTGGALLKLGFSDERA